MREKINHVKKYFNQVVSIAQLINKNEINFLVKQLVKIKKNLEEYFF